MRESVFLTVLWLLVAVISVWHRTGMATPSTETVHSRDGTICNTSCSNVLYGYRRRDSERQGRPQSAGRSRPLSTGPPSNDKRPKSAPRARPASAGPSRRVHVRHHSLASVCRDIWITYRYHSCLFLFSFPGEFIESRSHPFTRKTHFINLKYLSCKPALFLVDVYLWSGMMQWNLDPSLR